MIVNLTAVQGVLTASLNQALIRNDFPPSDAPRAVEDALRLLQTIGIGPLHEVQAPLRHLMPYPVDPQSSALSPSEAAEYVGENAAKIAALIYSLQKNVPLPEAQMTIGGLSLSSGLDALALVLDAKIGLPEIADEAKPRPLLSEKSAMTMVLDATARVTGKEFLHSLVEHLAHSLGAPFAFVSLQREEAPDEMEVLSLWTPDGPAPTFRYRLNDTPCEVVMREGRAHFASDVRTRFPNDSWLLKQNISGYFAVAFTNAHGKPIGHLGVMSRGPLTINDDHLSAFNLLAGRVGAEVERILAERHLKESEKRFRQIAENIDAVVVMANATADRILYANPAFEKVWGVPIEELYWDARTWMKSVHPEDQTLIMASFENMVKSGELDQEFRIIRNNGEVAWVHGRAYPVRDHNGNLMRIVAIVSDVTERNRLEQSLRQAQKMEALGTVMGGIAHDFNNILQVFGVSIDCSIEALQSLPASPGAKDIESDLELARDVYKKASRLIRGMLDFARPNEYRLRASDMRPLLESVRDQLRRKAIAAQKKLQIRMEMSGNCFVQIDANKMETAVMNLAVNALHAVGNPGQIVFRTEIVDLDKHFCATRADLTPGRYVAVSVSDDGVGIRPENIGKIFDPFFTTKRPGEGTGLGLAMVYAHIRAHRGLIEVESEVNKGTTFTFYLPLSKSRPLPPEAAGKPKNFVAKPGFTILIVDDTEIVRWSLSRLVERIGFRVLQAEHGHDALDIYRQQKPDLVIMDYQLPHMNGVAAANLLLRENPDIPIILSTGDASQSDQDVLAEAGISACLAKPYGKDDLIKHFVKLGAMVEDGDSPDKTK